jgi:fructose-1,6-bisphosphatase/inositol monophosphatase family enzyme
MPDEGESIGKQFVNVFRLAALQAGAVARQLQNYAHQEFKAGEPTPESAALTAVDLAVQELILLLLRHFYPYAAVDAEEDTETLSLFPQPRAGTPLIVVDPIDGTLNYSKGSTDYAVMGGILEHRRYQASLLYFPQKEEMYWATAGGGCWRYRGQGREPLQIRIGSMPNRAMITPDVPEKWRRRLREMGLEVAVSRCSAVDASAPVSGRAAVSVSVGRPDRRRSLGYLLVKEAGGSVFMGDREWKGEDPFDNPRFKGPTVVALSWERGEQVQRDLMRS